MIEHVTAGSGDAATAGSGDAATDGSGSETTAAPTTKEIYFIYTYTRAHHGQIFITTLIIQVGGDALASCTVRTFRQRLCNQRGW